MLKSLPPAARVSMAGWLLQPAVLFDRYHAEHRKEKRITFGQNVLAV